MSNFVFFPFSEDSRYCDVAMQSGESIWVAERFWSRVRLGTAMVVFVDFEAEVNEFETNVVFTLSTNCVRKLRTICSQLSHTDEHHGQSLIAFITPPSSSVRFLNLFFCKG